MASGKTSREYELKLAGTARDLPAFKRAVNAAANERQTWQSSELTTRYFDTPEHGLFKQGIALRVRRAKGKFLQTLKADRGGGGALDRTEWEQPVADAEPDLESLPKPARRKIGSVSRDALHPMIGLDVRRQKTVIRRPGTTGADLEVEAVVDKGVVQAGDKTSRFAECELELLRGEPEDFFRLAAEIHDACPLRLSRTTKSDRGYALLNGRGFQAVKLPRMTIRSEQTTNEILGSLFERCVGNIIDNEAAALDGKDPEGVHQLRVSVRRLRSSLSVFERILDADRVAWLRDELKWLGVAFGVAREWDVFLTETLASVAGYGIDPRGTTALAALARHRRRAGYDRVRKTLKSDRYAKLMLRLTAFAATQGWLPAPPDPKSALFAPVGDHAAAILERPYAKLLKAGKGLRDQDPVQRHQVRIKLKKLRYTVDLLGSLYAGKDAKKFLKRLQRLQEQFGHLNDVAQATDHVGALVRPNQDFPAPSDRARTAAGAVLGWYAHGFRESERTLLEDWDAFAAMPPPWRSV